MGRNRDTVISFINNETEILTNKAQLIETKNELEVRIPNAVANSTLALLDNHRDELKPGEICILVSRHEQADNIRDALANANLPSKLVNQGDVLITSGAQILQRFLDCLANPGDSGSLRLLACTALMQWNKEKLLKAEENGEIDLLAEKFENWAKSIKRLGLLGCLSELLKGETIADISAGA